MTNQANNGQQMGGFVAGTLVHTKEGMKPIEQIKVGDYVLSQPEMKGERAYKRVARTFEYEDKVVRVVSFQRIHLTQDFRNELSKSGEYENLVVTPNHPFWVKGYLSDLLDNPNISDIGWTRADCLNNNDIVELADGSQGMIASSFQLFATNKEKVSWAYNFERETGHLVYEQRNGGVEYDRSESLYDGNWLRGNENAPEYQAKVYNLEVEEFHTYYVGKFGICVHNTCADTVHIEISITNQTLTLFDHHNGVKAHYNISTASNGTGCEKNSGCTPLGAHIIRAKIGAGAPVNTVFSSRRPTGEICTPELMAQFPERDWILTRILWLSGTEIGKNRLGNMDSMQRYIYIHGTPDSEPMGVPRSHGCVRMRNVDVVALFDAVDVGTRVLIS
jgi:hypothetical protein